MFALKGPKMQKGVKGYDTNFPLEHASKDIKFAQLLGDEHGLSMGVSSAANGKYLSPTFILFHLSLRTKTNVLIVLLHPADSHRMVQSCKGPRS